MPDTGSVSLIMTPSRVLPSLSFTIPLRVPAIATWPANQNAVAIPNLVKRLLMMAPLLQGIAEKGHLKVLEPSVRRAVGRFNSHKGN